MTAERIDVEVTDKVDAGVATKLGQIASAAQRGETYVNRLKTAIASVNGTAVDRLAAAMAKADSAQARLISAQARLTNAQNAGSIAANRNALAQQKIATEAARTEAAQARASAATSAAALAAQRLSAAQQAATGASATAANAQQQLAGATMGAGTAAAGAGNSFRAYMNSLNATTVAANNATTGAVMAGQRMANGMNMGAGAAMNYQRAARQTTAANANIIAQMQDIGVSLAGGQNPLLVMIQQGSQLSYIASTMEGGWRSLTATIFRLVAPLTMVAAVLGGLYLGFRNFTADMGTRHNAELTRYANTLGLSAREMRRLQGETVSANGTLREHNQLVITSGDSWNGFIATVQEGLQSFRNDFAEATTYMGTTWSSVLNFLGEAFIGFYGLVHGLIALLANMFTNSFRLAANVIIGIFNAVSRVIQGAVNLAIDGINTLIRGANSVAGAMGFGVMADEIERANFAAESLSSNMFEFQSLDLGGTVRGAMAEARTTLQNFGDRWEANTVDAARTRIRGVADALTNNRNPGAANRGAGREQKTQLDYINETNAALDNEISRMRMLKEEREVQQRLDTIEQEFMRRRMPLDAAQIASFRTRIQAIADYRHVQQESDRIVEEAVGPLRTYNAVVTATTDLVARQAITQAEASRQTVLAARALEESRNPLMAMNEAMTTAETTLGLYGDRLVQANYYESIRQAMLSKGVILSQTYVSGVNAEVDALMRRNAALTQGQYIQSQVASLIDPLMEQSRFMANYQAMYDEINRLRQLDLEHEEVYQRALYALQVRFNEMRLGAASSFFGALSEVTKNGTGAVGAISKAAAIAQATIDGYVAVQRALASAPPPWNYVAAAAVAIKAGAQVAGIVSTNVGGYATGGQFMVGGRSGVDANNINMNVTRGERVTVETAAQQRAADSGGSSQVTVPVKVVNVYDPAEAIAAMESDAGERAILNVLRRNPNAVSSIAQNGGGIN